MNDVHSLLSKAGTFSSESPEFVDWSDRVVCEFETQPKSKLDHFDVTRFNYRNSPGHEYQLVPRSIIDGETSSLVERAWRMAGGIEDPDRGAATLAAASVEFVRAQLHSVLWFASRLPIYRTHHPAGADQFLAKVQSIDWHDSRSVLRAQFQVLLLIGAVESAADNLYDWTANVRPGTTEAAFAGRSPALKIQPALTQRQLMAGAALLWIDGALDPSDPLSALGLMSCAANSMWHAGFMAGWEGLEEMQRMDAKHAGRRGGSERHRATRELKQWALAEAMTLRGADIEIARTLAKILPEPLRDVSADPERLIYEALRSARAAGKER